MKEIETLCKTCMGCEREAEKDFKEVYRCKNYAKGKEYRDDSIKVVR